MKTDKRPSRPGAGSEPEKSPGTVWAEQTRAQCNKLTDTERERLLHRAMQIAYGPEAEPVPPRRR